MARALVALAVLLALAVPAVAPFSNPRSPGPPAAAAAPAPPAILSGAPLPVPEAVLAPALDEEAGPVEATVPCVRAMQVVVHGWTREVTDRRTDRWADLGLAGGAVSAEAAAQTAEADASAAQAALDASVAALQPALAGLPVGAGEAAQAAALLDAAHGVSIHAALLLDWEYVVWTPHDYVFLVPAVSLLPEGLAGVPVAGCFEATQLPQLTPGVVDSLFGQLVAPQDGWRLSGVRAPVSFDLPVLPE